MKASTTPTSNPNHRVSNTYANPSPVVAHPAVTRAIPRGSRSGASMAATAGAQRTAVMSTYPTNGSIEHLRYTESSPIHVRGPATGKTYQFSGAQPLQAVDTRDAASLLQTRFFRRA